MTKLKVSQMAGENVKSAVFELDNSAKSARPEPPKENAPLGVGSAAYNPGFKHGSPFIPQKKNPVLPDNLDYDYGDNDDDDDDFEFEYNHGKKRTGLIVFLIFLIAMISALIVLQLTGKIQLEDLPKTVIAFFEKGKSSEEEMLLNAGSSDLGLQNDENGIPINPPGAVDLDEVTAYELAKPEVFDNLEVTIGEIKVVSKYNDLSPEEGEVFLLAKINIKNVSADPSQNIRYSPYNFKLFIPDKGEDKLPTIKNEIERALMLGQLSPEASAEGFIFFPVSKDSQVIFLSYFPRDSEKPLAKYEINLENYEVDED